MALDSTRDAPKLVKVLDSAGQETSIRRYRGWSSCDGRDSWYEGGMKGRKGKKGKSNRPSFGKEVRGVWSAGRGGGRKFEREKMRGERRVRGEIGEGQGVTVEGRGGCQTSSDRVKHSKRTCHTIIHLSKRTLYKRVANGLNNKIGRTTPMEEYGQGRR